jgi:hypothetical protein
MACKIFRYFPFPSADYDFLFSLTATMPIVARLYGNTFDCYLWSIALEQVYHFDCFQKNTGSAMAWNYFDIFDFPTPITISISLHRLRRLSLACMAILFTAIPMIDRLGTSPSLWLFFKDIGSTCNGFQLFLAVHAPWKVSNICTKGRGCLLCTCTCTWRVSEYTNLCSLSVQLSSGTKITFSVLLLLLLHFQIENDWNLIENEY